MAVTIEGCLAEHEHPSRRVSLTVEQRTTEIIHRLLSGSFVADHERERALRDLSRAIGAS